MHPRLKQCLDHLAGYASVPKTISAVMKVVEDPNATPEDLARLLEQDKNLVHLILRTANSALYSLSGEIQNIRHAVTLLGFDTVRTLATVDTLKLLFDQFGVIERRIWEHCALSGIVAARLALNHVVQVDPGDAFMVGLLHDIGKVAINNTFRREYARVVARAEATRSSIVVVERAQFGFDHAEAGEEVAKLWSLSDPIRIAIRYHHDSSVFAKLGETERKLTALAAVTSACCSRLGIGCSEPIGRPDPDALIAWVSLGLTANDGSPVFQLVSEAARRGKELLA